MGEKRKALDGSESLDCIRSLKKINKKFDNIIKNEKSTTVLDDNLTNHDSPLTQDDVVYFQKQAIFRLFNLQYNKNKILLDNLSIINNNYSKLLIYNSILIQWWFQILDNLKSLFKIDPNLPINDDILISLNNLNSNLFNSKEENNEVNDNNDSLLLKLNDLRDNLIKLLNSIFNNKDLNIDSNKILNLENKISSLSTINKKLDNEILTLKKLNSNLNLKLENIIKSNDRSNSKSLDRIKDDSIDNNINNTHISTSNTTSTNSNSDNNNSKTACENSATLTANETIIKSENSTNGSSSDSKTQNNNNKIDEIPNDLKSEINDLKLKIIELNSKNDTLNDQLNQKIKINLDYENKINELNLKLNHLSNDDLLKISSIYRNAIEENKKLNNSIIELNLSKKKLESQMFELESKFSINKSKIEEKLNLELSNNSNYISKLENDINRIRSDRDSLNSKLNILEKEKSKNELIENFNKLIPILQNRINELEDLKNKNFENLSNDENNKIIINELKQIENAFKSTREIIISKLIKNSEFDVLINKLSIEKSKADEKYFQAMRTKDSLSSQNKILSSNLTKQMELIEILKSNENELKSKLLIEEKLFNNLQNIETLYKDNIIKLESRIENFEKKLNEKSEIENDLRSQISKYQFELQQLDKKLLSCQQDLNVDHKKIDHYKSIISSHNHNNNNTNNHSSNTKTEDSEIQEALLSMTKCSLCGKNFKNVALKTCGHCFCKDCVDDRLNARMRKCPTCNQQFSRYDLLTIHL